VALPDDGEILRSGDTLALAGSTDAVAAARELISAPTQSQTPVAAR